MSLKLNVMADDEFREGLLELVKQKLDAVVHAAVDRRLEPLVRERINELLADGQFSFHLKKAVEAALPAELNKAIDWADLSRKVLDQVGIEKINKRIDEQVGFRLKVGDEFKKLAADAVKNVLSKAVQW